MHRIFSNLRGFIIFEFTTSGNGWEDDFSSGGDKERSYFFNFPGDGIGVEEGNTYINELIDGDSYGPYYHYGNGETGDLDGDSDCEDELDEFYFEIDHDA